MDAVMVVLLMIEPSEAIDVRSVAVEILIVPEVLFSFHVKNHSTRSDF